MQDIAKLLILFGSVALLVGLGLLLAGQVPWLGRLPGDVVVREGRSRSTSRS